MKRRVVITGIGPYTSLGTTKEDLFDSLIKKKYKINEIPKEFCENYNFKSRFYVPKPEISINNLSIDKRFNLLMSDSAKLSVLSSYGALKDAKINIFNKDNKFKSDELEHCNIIVGTGMPNLETAFNSYTSHAFSKELTRTRFNRMVIPITMPNSLSAWISIIFGINNLNYTINASCSSGSYAIGEAYFNILNNRCEMALAGGVESLYEEKGSIMRGFDVLGALTKSKDGLPRPFSQERSGFLFNEGAACILVLEELELAKRRNAKIYAEIIGFESNSDSYNIVEMNPDGKKIKKIINKLLSKEIKIDYLNAHGTGTVLNDQVEKKIIIDIFGKKDNQPIINSTKGIIGHSLGASGAIEIAITAMSIKNSIIHGNLIEKSVDEINLNINSIKKEINYAMSTQYGFGGHNAAILLKRYIK